VVTDSYGRMHTAPVEEDRWIESYINPDVDNPTVHIHHKEATVDTVAAKTTNLNNPALDTITIQDTSYDEAGHLTANKNHPYILPYGFKTITSDNNGSYEAKNTQDTISITASDKWLDTNISGNTLDITHKFTPGELKENT
jgi:hypothetical protein